MVAAMQHTTRCMPTPAQVLVAFCRPRNVNVVAWECRIVRFQCLALPHSGVTGEHKANALPNSQSLVPRSPLAQTTGLYLGTREHRYLSDVIAAILLLLVVAGGLLLSRRILTTPRSGQLWLP